LCFYHKDEKKQCQAHSNKNAGLEVFFKVVQEMAALFFRWQVAGEERQVTGGR